MPDKPKSWKDIRNKRREENFVGRGSEIRDFTENFSETPNYMIFAVTGEGGVGKSTLLERFTTIATATEMDAIVVICDEHQNSPVAAMGHVASELAKLDISHKEFDNRYKKYCELRQEIESDPNLPRSAVDVISLGITDFTIKSLRKTPGVGVFAEYVDEKAAGEALAELVQYGIGKWGNKDEVRLLREPENILTPLFLELLQKASEEKRLIIMFDVFERTGDVLSSWLLALFDFEYGEFSTQLSFVISGRDPLEQHWTELAGMICFIQLEPFTEEETKLYLNNQGISDKKLVDEIYQATSGLPVLLELLAATKPQPGQDLPDISKDAVERFLQWTPHEDKRQAALLAAVPRQFNQDILTAVLGDNVSELFNWLASQSYIRKTMERGWFYHEKVRELMLRYILKTKPSELRDTHIRLSEFFETSRNGLGLANNEAYEDEVWCDYEIERVYHLLSSYPGKNIPRALNAVLNATRWRWNVSEKIMQIIQQVKTEKGGKKLTDLSRLLMDINDAYERNENNIFIDKITPLISRKGLTSEAYSAIFYRRGEVFRLTGNYDKALDDLSRAIEFDDKYPKAIAVRGETYRLMEKYGEAISDFNSAIELDEEYAWAIAHRGTTYRSMKKYEEALSDFDRAIELNEEYAWAIAVRGATYRLMKKYEEALADFDRAIELNEDDAWAIAVRGATYLDQKNMKKL